MAFTGSLPSLRSLLLRTLVAAAALAAPTAPLMAQPAAEDKPSAVLVDPIHDFGELELGERVTHEFVIRNPGGAPLELFDASSSCGCTVVDFDAVVAPGGEGRFQVELDTSSQDGAFAVNVGVLTNDPRNPRLNLTLKAELRYRVRARPGYARWVTHQGVADDHRRRQVLWSADGGDLKVLAVSSPYPFVEVGFRPADDDERLEEIDAAQWIVDVELSNEAPVGPMNAVVRVVLEHPRQSELQIPVYGFVGPAIEVVPAELDFGRIDPEQGQAASLRVESFSGGALDIRRVESTVGGLLVSLAGDRSGSEQVRYVRVQTAESFRRGPFEGLVRLYTSNPLQPVVEIPVRGDVD